MFYFLINYTFGEYNILENFLYKQRTKRATEEIVKEHNEYIWVPITIKYIITLLKNHDINNIYLKLHNILKKKIHKSFILVILEKHVIQTLFLELKKYFYLNFYFVLATQQIIKINNKIIFKKNIYKLLKNYKSISYIELESQLKKLYKVIDADFFENLEGKRLKEYLARLKIILELNLGRKSTKIVNVKANYHLKEDYSFIDNKMYKTFLFNNIYRRLLNKNSLFFKGYFKIFPSLYMINFNKKLSFIFLIGFLKFRPIFKTYTINNEYLRKLIYSNYNKFVFKPNNKITSFFIFLKKRFINLLLVFYLSDIYALKLIKKISEPIIEISSFKIELFLESFITLILIYFPKDYEYKILNLNKFKIILLTYINKFRAFLILIYLQISNPLKILYNLLFLSFLILVYSIINDIFGGLIIYNFFLYLLFISLFIFFIFCIKKFRTSFEIYKIFFLCWIGYLYTMPIYFFFKLKKKKKMHVNKYIHEDVLWNIQHSEKHPIFMDAIPTKFTWVYKHTSLKKKKLLGIKIKGSRNIENHYNLLENYDKFVPIFRAKNKVISKSALSTTIINLKLTLLILLLFFLLAITILFYKRRVLITMHDNLENTQAFMYKAKIKKTLFKNYLLDKKNEENLDFLNGINTWYLFFNNLSLRYLFLDIDFQNLNNLNYLYFEFENPYKFIAEIKHEIKIVEKLDKEYLKFEFLRMLTLRRNLIFESPPKKILNYDVEPFSTWESCLETVDDLAEELYLPEVSTLLFFSKIKSISSNLFIDPFLKSYFNFYIKEINKGSYFFIDFKRFNLNRLLKNNKIKKEKKKIDFLNKRKYYALFYLNALTDAEEEINEDFFKNEFLKQNGIRNFYFNFSKISKFFINFNIKKIKILLGNDLTIEKIELFINSEVYYRIFWPNYLFLYSPTEDEELEYFYYIQNFKLKVTSVYLGFQYLKYTLSYKLQTKQNINYKIAVQKLKNA